MTALANTYIAVGAGGLCVIAIIYITLYLIKKITPEIQKQSQMVEHISSSNERHIRVIDNNTEAIREMSKSNDNMAMALNILDKSVTGVMTSLDRHDQRSVTIERAVTQIKENTRHCRDSRYEWDKPIPQYNKVRRVKR